MKYLLKKGEMMFYGFNNRKNEKYGVEGISGIVNREGSLLVC